MSIIASTATRRRRTGSVAVNGVANVCPMIDGISASPSEVLVGGTIALTGAAHDADSGPRALSYQWQATCGTISNAASQNPTFTCTAAGRGVADRHRLRRRPDGRLRADR